MNMCYRPKHARAHNPFMTNALLIAAMLSTGVAAQTAERKRNKRGLERK